jgi:hypothetical protein
LPTRRIPELATEVPMPIDFSSFPPETIEQIKSALHRGQKIEAIKRYREATGQGLKESKDFIEELDRQLRGSEPQLFLTGPKGTGCGVGLLAIVLIGGGGVLTL